MENSLTLSLLPTRMAFDKAVAALRSHAQSPALRLISDALLSTGRHGSRDVTACLDEASEQARAIIKDTAKTGVEIVPFWSQRYPERLREIERPPWCLFVKGTLPPASPALAIVGTRRPNAYGKEVVARIVPALQTRPLVTVSGLAYGIDALSHHYSCIAGVPTFAVLGSGIDRLYPAEHEQLADRIISNGGGVISEFPPGCIPHPKNFPRRNRIISALAHVVWIVQGTVISGSLHTARYALEQGRSVATTPGDMFAELSALPHRLLLEGAHPVIDATSLDLLLQEEKVRET